MSQVSLDGRVAIITGAGAGIGRSHALELGKRGAMVVVNDLGAALDGSGNSISPANDVVAEITGAGGKAVANYDSVATMEGAEKIVKTAIDTFGTLDIVVNNAGIVRDKGFGKMAEEDWDWVQKVHLQGTFNVTRAAWPVMKEHNYGRVIFTSSGVGLYGNFGQANYSAAKMGMIGLMNTLRIEGAKNNILVNAIAPNAATRMTKNVLPPQVYDHLKPEYISPLVAYLCSEHCKESGMIFNCMGGWYSRTAIMCSDGVILDKKEVTAEDIMANWDRIISMENKKTIGSVQESFSYLSVFFNK